MKGNFPTENDVNLYNRLMFFKPLDAEKKWTGDIYRPNVDNNLPFDKYAIIITPKCDLVQRNPSRIMVCYGFPMKEEHLDDPTYPPLKHDPRVVERLANDKDVILKWIEKRHPEELAKIKELIDNFPRITDTTFPEVISGKIESISADFKKYMKKRYLEPGNLPDNLHLIYNFKDGDVDIICFDFDNVRVVESSVIDGWERICRLDSPFIEEILEKYGAMISRVGVPGCNKNKKQLKAIFEKK